MQTVTHILRGLGLKDNVINPWLELLLYHKWIIFTDTKRILVHNILTLIYWMLTSHWMNKCISKNRQSLNFKIQMKFCKQKWQQILECCHQDNLNNKYGFIFTYIYSICNCMYLSCPSTRKSAFFMPYLVLFTSYQHTEQLLVLHTYH